MHWYYAEKNEKRGPFSDDEIRERVAGGTIQAETLVWNSTMTAWTPAKDTVLLRGAGADTGETQRCLITGRLYPTSQMIKTEHGWVSVDGKELYYQSLREGAPIPVAENMSNARRDGKKVVVPVANPRLPLRCFRTNQPVTPGESRRRTLYWCTPWVYLALLLNLLIVLILYLILRKKLELDVPVSAAGRSSVRKNAAIAWAALVVGIGLVIWDIASADPGAGILVGFLLMLFAAFFGQYKGTLIRIVRLKNGEAWLAGAPAEYVAELPPYLGLSK